jgi:quercetin dioxygenase-like cupin family protein
MRKIGLLLAAALSLAAAAPSAPPPFDVHVAVPQDRGVQEVNSLVRVFPRGGTSGWHVHPGTEIAYLLSGEMELQSVGAPPRRMRPGDHFVMPRGRAHNGVTVGPRPAKVLVTYVVDKGVPVRSAVPPPQGQ